METKKAVEIDSYYSPMDTWFSVKVYPSQRGLTIFYRDITAARKAEQEAADERNLSESAINSLPGVFYMYRPQWKSLHAGTGILKLYRATVVKK